MFVLFITVELCLYGQLIFNKEVDVSEPRVCYRAS